MNVRRHLKPLFLFFQDKNPKRYVAVKLPTSLFCLLSLVTFASGYLAFYIWFGTAYGFLGFCAYFIFVFFITYYLIKLFTLEPKQDMD